MPQICRKPWIFATIFAAICLNEFAAANFAAMDLPLAAAMRQIDMYNLNTVLKITQVVVFVDVSQKCFQVKFKTSKQKTFIIFNNKKQNAICNTLSQIYLYGKKYSCRPPPSFQNQIMVYVKSIYLRTFTNFSPLLGFQK